MANQPLGKLDHIGIAVNSVDEARKFFEETLGARFLHESSRPQDGFRVLNFELQGMIIELIEPVGGDSFVRKFIDKRGEGMHHLTFNVPDARDKVAQLKAQESESWTNGNGPKGRKTPTRRSSRRAPLMEC